MARRFGDILPNASGRANIGVEEGVQAGSFSDTIVPFATIHQLSGILHHAGSSGILRFNSQCGIPADNITPVHAFEVSVNGGISYDHLVPSGAITAMILVNEQLHFYTETFTASRYWEVNHNLNTTDLIVHITDETAGGPPSHTIEPDDIEHVGIDDVVIRWANPQAGTVIIKKCDE